MSLPLYEILPERRLERRGDEVEERRLAGPVRADQPQDLSLVHVEIDVGHRGQAAEIPSHSFTFKQGHVDLL